MIIQPPTVCADASLEYSIQSGVLFSTPGMVAIYKAVGCRTPGMVAIYQAVG